MKSGPFSFALLVFVLNAGSVWAQSDASPRALAQPGASIYDEELGRANERIAAQPGDARGWYERSYLNYLQGEWAQSLVDCDTAERLAPGRFPVGWVRGQALAASGNLSGGKAELDVFLQTHPEHAAALAARARLRLKLGETEEAFVDFRAALVHARAIDAGLYLEITEAYLAHGRREEATRLLANGLVALNDSPLLLVKALELEIATGDYANALKRIDALQSLAPQPAPWMARRAEVLALAGRQIEANRAWRELLTYLDTLPNLQRGAVALQSLATQARSALAMR